jgi:hypothetical protein
MAQNNLCAEIAEKYANFQKTEKAWRNHLKNAKTDKDDRQVAHFGMKEVRESFRRRLFRRPGHRNGIRFQTKPENPENQIYRGTIERS